MNDIRPARSPGPPSHKNSIAPATAATSANTLPPAGTTRSAPDMLTLGVELAMLDVGTAAEEVDGLTLEVPVTRLAPPDEVAEVMTT